MPRMEWEMKILITGGCGFIGSNAVSYFHGRGHDIEVIDKLTYAADRKRLPVGVLLYEEDIALVNWATLLNHITPDVIINFAAETHVDNSIIGAQEFINSNYLGVYNLVMGFRHYVKDKPGKLLIHISTDEVYGDLDFDSVAKFKEGDILKPNNPYSATKAAADLMIQALHHTYEDFNYVICRAANNYGPNQAMEKFLPTIIRSALEDEPIPIYGRGKNVREWLWVHDFIEGIDTVIKKCFPCQIMAIPNSIFNFGSRFEARNINTVKLVLRYMDKPKDLMSFVQDRPGHDRRYAIDWSRAKEFLDWSPEMDFELGIKLVIEDIKERMG